MKRDLRMESTRHLFWSSSGEMLPRWTQAFAGAQLISHAMPAPSPDQSMLAWIRIAPHLALDQQVAQVRARLGGVPVIVLSDMPDDREALAAFSAGARGYCNSHATPEVLQQVAGVVQQGGLWIGENLMQKLVQATLGISVPVVPAQPDWQARLTERERQVAQAVAGGAPNKEIARQLGITERTVKAHITTILDKLGVRDRLQLALLVHQKAS